MTVGLFLCHCHNQHSAIEDIRNFVQQSFGTSMVPANVDTVGGGGGVFIAAHSKVKVCSLSWRICPVIACQHSLSKHPLTNVGVDYIGSFDNIEVRIEKRHVCTFTCLVERVVHFEVAKNSTKHCFSTFRQFLASKGAPNLKISGLGFNPEIQVRPEISCQNDP